MSSFAATAPVDLDSPKAQTGRGIVSLVSDDDDEGGDVRGMMRIDKPLADLMPQTPISAAAASVSDREEMRTKEALAAAAAAVANVAAAKAAKSRALSVAAAKKAAAKANGKVAAAAAATSASAVAAVSQPVASAMHPTMASMWAMHLNMTKEMARLNEKVKELTGLVHEQSSVILTLKKQIDQRPTPMCLHMNGKGTPTSTETEWLKAFSANVSTVMGTADPMVQRPFLPPPPPPLSLSSGTVQASVPIAIASASAAAAAAASAASAMSVDSSRPT